MPPRSRLAGPIVVLALAAPSVGSAWSWGFEAHRIVADNARALLPQALRSFLDPRAEALRDAVLEPDTVLRGASGRAETLHHFLELDRLGHFPFRDLPADRRALIERFGAEAVERAGSLPWRVEEILLLLTEEMRAGDWDVALRHAGWLAHYVADATQPLHATRHYDGEEGCGRGIHQAFERRLIERHPERYRRAAARRQNPAAPIDRPVETALRLLVDAYPHHRQILEGDRIAVERVRNGDGDYFEILEKRLRPLAEEQLAAAGTAVASFWLTAWIDAGRPEPPPAPPAAEGR